MFRVNLEGIAGIVAIQSEGRHQQRPIDADRVHRCHHLVAGDLSRPRQESAPRTLRTIPLVGIDLGVNRGTPSCHRTCPFPRPSEYRKSREEARLSPCPLQTERLVDGRSALRRVGVRQQVRGGKTTALEEPQHNGCQMAAKSAAPPDRCRSPTTGERARSGASENVNEVRIVAYR